MKTLPMIVAYTHNDADTNVLKGYALEFLELAPRQGVHVLKPRHQSNAANIRATLKANLDIPFLFFGHGSQTPGNLLGQDHLPAVDKYNVPDLANRFVYACCCHGIGTLKPAANNHNATIIGYDGLLHLPRKAPYIFDHEDCILTGLRALLAGKTAQDSYEAMAREYQNVIGRLLATTNGQITAVQSFQPNAAALRLVGNGTITL